MTLQNEIQSTVTSDFLEQMIIPKSFNSVFSTLTLCEMKCCKGLDSILPPAGFKQITPCSEVLQAVNSKAHTEVVTLVYNLQTLTKS